MFWDQERTEKCVSLWNEGLSSSVIAQRLGGITRNAVIGKIQRVSAAAKTDFVVTRKPVTRASGRPPEKPTTRKKFKRADGQFRSPIFAATPLPPEPVRPAKLVSFEKLTEKTCRFVYGDPKGSEPWGYCTHERAVGSSYCEGHHGVCCTAPPVRRRPSVEEPTYTHAAERFGSRYRNKEVVL
jgi:GcrA cell cycle regulator